MNALDNRITLFSLASGYWHLTVLKKSDLTLAPLRGGFFFSGSDILSCPLLAEAVEELSSEAAFGCPLFLIADIFFPLRA
jgi:hypothetical protein